jgi:hypothetical protein
MLWSHNHKYCLKMPYLVFHRCSVLSQYVAFIPSSHITPLKSMEAITRDAVDARWTKVSFSDADSMMKLCASVDTARVRGIGSCNFYCSHCQSDRWAAIPGMENASLIIVVVNLNMDWV